MKGNYPDPNFGWGKNSFGPRRRFSRFIGIVIVTRRVEVIINVCNGGGCGGASRHAVTLLDRGHWRKEKERG